MFSVTSMIEADGQWDGMGGTPQAFCSAPTSGCWVAAKEFIDPLGTSISCSSFLHSRARRDHTKHFSDVLHAATCGIAYSKPYSHPCLNYIFIWWYYAPLDFHRDQPILQEQDSSCSLDTSGDNKNPYYVCCMFMAEHVHVLYSGNFFLILIHYFIIISLHKLSF